jgi:hypothetical protein
MHILQSEYKTSLSQIRLSCSQYSRHGSRICLYKNTVIFSFTTHIRVSKGVVFFYCNLAKILEFHSNSQCIAAKQVLLIMVISNHTCITYQVACIFTRTSRQNSPKCLLGADLIQGLFSCNMD